MINVLLVTVVNGVDELDESRTNQIVVALKATLVGDD
jgi:hypothetical protein